MTNTADVEKFNILSQDWWDLNGPLKTLHHINPARLAFIKAHEHVKGKQILDVGCGGGLLTESLANTGAIMTGIDLATDSIETAKQHAKESKLQIDFQVISIEDFNQTQAKQFDTIACMELLEHLEDPEIFLKSLAQALKPGGKLFLSTVNRNPKSYFLAIAAAEYIMNLLPKGTHDYHQFIKPSELHAVMDRLNFDFISIQGISYNPLLKSAKLTDDLSVNYIACYQKAT